MHNGPFEFDKNEASEIKFFSLEKLSAMIKSEPESFKANLLEILYTSGL